MGRIYESITELIGGTPVLKAAKFKEEENLSCNIFTKLEAFNPGSSVKDRISLRMIERGIEEGLIKEGSILIEPTSGNTGIGLAIVARAKGLRLILTMPETMSVERRDILSALGAEIVLTEGKLGMKGAIMKAEELSKENPGSVILQQFENEANPEAHRETTAQEILDDFDGVGVDILVAGVGTGGTLTGVGEVLKKTYPDLKIVAVEPSASSVLAGGEPSPHKIQGIGAGFVPKIMNMAIVDEIIGIDDEEAFKYGKLFAKTEGFLGGISSGAALAAAVEIGSRKENEGKNILVVLPDTGERYLSTLLYK